MIIVSQIRLRTCIYLWLLLVVTASAPAQVRIMAQPAGKALATVPDPRFLRGQALEAQGKLEEARAIYDSLYQANPNDMLFWKLILINERTGGFKDMERLASQRIKTHSGDLSVVNYLSRALYGLGDQARARRVLLDSIGDNWKS